MGKKIVALATGTQIRELSLQEFVDDLNEILALNPGLKGLQASSLSLQDMETRKTVSLSFAAEKIFNIQGDSELLTKLTDAIKAYYKD